MHDTSPPASAPPERRLAAVLFVDLVGYSSLAAEDEQRAMSLLALFHASAREAISACSGTLVKTIGDAAFAEFASTERAVRCALRLRHEFPARARAEQIPVQLRIGVHVGDAVTAPDGDLYGDGVNIAARLQREAAPDQVVVSEAVWQQLRQRREYRFQPLGQRLLKGQQEAMRLYAVEPGEPGEVGGTGRRTRRWPWLRGRRSAAGTIALGLGLLGLGGLAGWLLRTAAEAPAAGASGTVRLEIVLPEDQLLQTETGGAPSDPFDISPDGSHLVYVAGSGRETRLFLRTLDDFAARALPGTEGALQPFFSPDGRWVGFFAERALRKVPIAGGEPITITGGIDRPAGASWSPRGTILVAIIERGLYTVAADGGDFVAVPQGATNTVDSPTTRAAWPSFLPDGEHALFDDGNSIWLLTLRTGAVRRLLRGREARYLQSGHLLFSEEDERVRLVSFDLDRLELTSSPVPVLDNVFRYPGGATSLAVSGTGTLVYLSGGFERSLVVVDRNGRATPLGLPPRGYRLPKVSPDGALLAVTVDPRPSDIWVVDLRRETATRLTTDQHNLTSVWSSDGSRLAFTRESDIVWTRWPATGEPLRPIEELPGWQFATSWMPDGRMLVMNPATPAGADIMILDPETGTAAPFLATSANETGAKASPDGRWVAYASDVSGVDEVYVVPLARDAAPRLVSVGGGREPVWSPDGRELFYRAGHRIMAVPWPPPAAPDLGQPVELFEARSEFRQGWNWDALPDGRFVMVRADPSTTSRFRVVLNWFAELEPPRQ